MKLVESLGIVVGVFGIIVLDIGFSGSAMTDLFYIPQNIKNAIPPVSSNLGGSVLGKLLPGGNTTIFLIGGGFLGLGMMILILHNRNRGKPFAVAVQP
jgi:hypothetical protein